MLHRLNNLQILSDSQKHSAVTSSKSTIGLYTVKVQSYLKVANESRERERGSENDRIEIMPLRSGATYRKRKRSFGVYERYAVLCDKCGRRSKTFYFLPSSIVDWNKRAVRTI